MITRTEEEIDEVLEKANSGEGGFSGMSYEQGVINAIEWLTGLMEESPMDD
jgi:hypothetical protein